MRFFHFFLFSFPILLVALSSEVRAQVTSGDNGGAKARSRACVARAAGGVESPRSGRLHGGLLEFSGADILLRRQRESWMAGDHRSLSCDVCESGARNGEIGILRIAHRNAGRRCGLCARCVAIGDVGWEDAARVVHAGVPQVSRWMEDCARPYFGGGVSFLHIYFLTRT